MTKQKIMYLLLTLFIIFAVSFVVKVLNLKETSAHPQVVRLEPPAEPPITNQGPELQQSLDAARLIWGPEIARLFLENIFPFCSPRTETPLYDENEKQVESLKVPRCSHFRNLPEGDNLPRAFLLEVNKEWITFLADFPKKWNSRTLDVGVARARWSKYKMKLYDFSTPVVLSDGQKRFPIPGLHPHLITQGEETFVQLGRDYCSLSNSETRKFRPLTAGEKFENLYNDKSEKSCPRQFDK